MLTKSECGKLGALKTLEWVKREKDKRVQAYSITPKACKFCNTEFSYKDRIKIFCNQSCSASFNNKITKPKSKRICIHCKNAAIKNAATMYCSSKCAGESYYLNVTKKLVYALLQKMSRIIWWRRSGFEPTTYGLKVRCFSNLSYASI